jgi:malate dehydrogenase (oxaloacetate-decarboxylating)
MSLKKESLEMHKRIRGKIEIKSRVGIKNIKDLSLAYTPGVAEPCREILKNLKKVYDYTARGNFVAIVTDGSAVLGLGNIGPEAALPVMEGKAVLFKEFAGVDAFPVCLATQEPAKVVEAVKMISPVFGGINLEDISSPRCFQIEARLKRELDIPVFHDDQHGTAVIVLASLINSLKLTHKGMGKVRVVINGAGAAGIAVARLLLKVGLKDIIILDRQGAIYRGRNKNMNSAKNQIARITNRKKEKGSLREVVQGKDVFIGVSAKGVLTGEMVRSMNRESIIFALANPDPEILPGEAKKGGARIIGTGRSDFPNQVNNVLAFPGIFRGALDARARDINEEMKIAASYALANLIKRRELREDYIIPNPLDRRVAPAIAKAVARAARQSGVAGI